MAEFKVSTDLSVVRGLKISANFDELKAELTKKVESYRTMLVTPETTAAAKNDLANLRRVQKDIDTVRLAWKREYMAPWDEFEAKCKELKAVLDGGISNLDTQIKGFEEAEANAKLDELHAFFETLLTDETRDFADWEKIKNSRWKNKTYDPVQARNEIQMAVSEMERSLMALRGYTEPYKSAMLEKFRETLRLADAINVFTQIKRREETEANLKRRQEEAERRAAEEAARQRSEARAANDRPYGDGGADSSTSLRMTAGVTGAARTAQDLSDALRGEMTHTAAENAAERKEGDEERIATASAEPRNDGFRRVEFWVEVTKEQSVKLGRFLRENGIRYGAIR